MTDHIEFLYDTVVKLRPGLKSRRVMVDKEKKLSEFSTADLVAELCSREWVRCVPTVENTSYEVWITNEYDHITNCAHGFYPDTIIVVRGDE